MDWTALSWAQTLLIELKVVSDEIGATPYEKKQRLVVLVGSSASEAACDSGDDRHHRSRGSPIPSGRRGRGRPAGFSRG